MHEALRATSRTLADYVESRLRDGSDPIATAFTNRTMQVYLDTPNEMGAKEGLSLWLYQVVRDDQQLNLPRQRSASREQRSSLPLRAHYLATPIVSPASDSTENEQLILGRVMQSLHDHPLFRGADLSVEFAGTATEFRVRLEPLAIEEITRVWEALQSSYQLSVSYEVTVVDLCSALEPRVYSPVHELVTDHGVIVAPLGGTR